MGGFTHEINHMTMVVFDTTLACCFVDPDLGIEIFFEKKKRQQKKRDFEMVG